MTEDEKRRLTPNPRAPLENRGKAGIPWKPLPGTELLLSENGENFDWRKQGVVTKVKNQGKDCGSDWAFSAIGAVESQYAIKYKTQAISFSEQQLVDCDNCDTGCFGGRPDVSYLSIEEYGGINTEADYPYKGVEETCKRKRVPLKASTFGYFYYTIDGDEDEILKALKTLGPIALGIAISDSYRYYKGDGIFRGSECTNQYGHHYVLLVGYGTRNGVKYWIIKNSWGAEWGSEGYLLLERGVKACQFGMYPTVPYVYAL